MNTADAADARRRLTLSLTVLAFVCAAIFVPYFYRSEAVTASSTQKGLIQRTQSHEPGLENYDIREVKSEEVAEALQRFRDDAGASAIGIADKRDGFVRGAEALKASVPTLKVEYNPRLSSPEVITPDVMRAQPEMLTGPSNMSRAEILRNFVKQNDQLIGIDPSQAHSLKVLADYENPSGNMSFAHLEQRIDGVPVFQSEIKAGFRKDGSMIRVINNLAPGLDYESLSRNFGDPAGAVRAAAGNINVSEKSLDMEVDEALSDENMKVFGRGPSATTAERMYFPTEIGVARPAWRVLIWQPVNAYYVIVDAETGITLWRKNITEDQTQSATYQVYRNANAFIDVADSPAPLSPGPIDPGLGTQGALLTRENVSLIGNEGPLSFNNNGWITDGANGTDGWTDGNFTEAGLDIDGSDGVDAPMPGAARVFTSAWNPPPGNPAPGDVPTTADARFGAVVQMFYVMNRYHDIMYQLGWTEPAFNFQDDNFGRGGAASDRVRSEGQDSSGTNNANMSTPADGARGRMQMFRFTGMDPDRDGTADADIIIHEITHGLSNRLHNNASGLGTNMARGMGEGWSDWYAHTLLAEPSDPIDGVYTTGGYSTLEITSGFMANYYYGIRRFPKAVIAFTGGPGNLPHNPLTFADLNAGCDLTDGAFPRGPIGSGTCDQVHNAGEIWSSALWELRALMVTRLGFAAGTLRALQVVTDGMKLAPTNPTFLQERDAIIAAAAALPANASADVSDVREGFRRRGMGFSAQVISASPANVVEAFDFPNIRVDNPITVSDAPGDNDGFPEPGEQVLVSVPVENSTGATITNVTVSVNGGTPVSYGSIADGNTVTNQIPYTIPASLGTIQCGAFFDLNIVATSDVGTQAPVVESIRLGAPAGGGGPETFASADGPINLPAGQPGSSSGAASPYPSVIDVSGLSGQKIIKVEITDMNHTWVDDIDMMLESPGGQKFVMMSDVFGNTDAVATTFTISDGGIDGLLPDGGPLVPGDYQPSNVGATDPFDAPAPAGPYENPAPVGSATFLSTFGSDGATMNGTWKLWIDDDAGGDVGTMAGWKITFEADEYVCSLGSDAFMDMDGDGKTDVSVFRAGGGALRAGNNPAPEGSSSEWWWINSSTSSVSALQFGNPSDIPVPADYTGDGKDDIAFYTPSNGTWYVLRSDDLTFFAFPFGNSTDIPAPGDFDGDGKADAAVFRPSEGVWYILRTSDGQVQFVPFGANGDHPMVADYDGDGTDDFAVYRAAGSEHWQLRSTDGFIAYNFGGPGDIPTVGDFTGDGKDDVGFFRPATGEWYVLRSEDFSYYAFPWGIATDIPTAGDFDGDGMTDAAVFRPSDNTWYINGTTSGPQFVPFGAAGDVPLPSVYTP